MNEYYAKTVNGITFKLGLLTTLLSDNITAKFHYFRMKTEKCYMEDKKTHKFPKNGPMNRQNYVIKLRHNIMFDLGYLRNRGEIT